ncbi:MAG TPA: LD-carboxypeptidase [Gemmatimonadaceae bacterium]|nr:LD-carboxypeptidase [Gemmatimonadaceae bacterium]
MPKHTSLAMPPLLASGSRVALIAPAGPLSGEHDVTLAVEQARSLGWEPIVAEHALARRGYFAGSDAERLRDLNSAIRTDSVDGIWCLRGGYGAMRILDGIDFDALRRRPKALIGFSDITALHAAIVAKCGLVSYHGPTARSPLAEFSRRSLVDATIHGNDPCGVAAEARTLRGGRASGRLAGGNLALVAALCGTPYAFDLDGAIVVLEDINEPVYRIDRMLQQLLLTGALRRCAGVVLGVFNNMPDGGAEEGRTLDDVFAELAATLQVPCIVNAPVGHIDEQWTIPIGRVAELDADARALHVEPVSVV